MSKLSVHNVQLFQHVHVLLTIHTVVIAVTCIKKFGYLKEVLQPAGLQLLETLLVLAYSTS